MKTISIKPLKSGKRRMIIEVDSNEFIIGLNMAGHYKLGYPHEDIVPAQRLSDAEEVIWCDIAQEWRQP